MEHYVQDWTDIQTDSLVGCGKFLYTWLPLKKNQTHNVYGEI